MPDRVSSSAWDAVLILINAVSLSSVGGGSTTGRSSALELGGGCSVGAMVGCRVEIWIRLPSSSGAARFNPERSALSDNPPAASIASCTRLPGRSAYRPGFCTAPLICTWIGTGVGGGSNSIGCPRGGWLAKVTTPAASNPNTTPSATVHQFFIVNTPVVTAAPCADAQGQSSKWIPEHAVLCAAIRRGGPHFLPVPRRGSTHPRQDPNGQMLQMAPRR